MKTDLERAAALAAELSGFEVDYCRTLIAQAQWVRGIEIEHESDLTWLRRQTSGWVINLALARLGETLHPVLSGELSRRVATIREAHNEADAKWLTTPDRIATCWRILYTVQQLTFAFDPSPRRK